MNEKEINKINNNEFELIYNSLFGSPVSVSINRGRENSPRYVNFIVNKIISGDVSRLQTVEIDNRNKSSELQEKRARILEFYVLNNSEKLFANDEAKTDIRENIKHSVNFLTKFETMTRHMYQNLKPEIQGDLVKNFAKSIALLKNQKLLSNNAVTFATENMSRVDSKFVTLLSKEINKNEEITNCLN